MLGGTPSPLVHHVTTAPFCWLRAPINSTLCALLHHIAWVKRFLIIDLTLKEISGLRNIMLTPTKLSGLKRTATREEMADKVIKLMTKNRNGREKPAEMLRI